MIGMDIDFGDIGSILCSRLTKSAVAGEGDRAKTIINSTMLDNRFVV